LPSEPEPSTTNREKVSYENAVHPAHIQKQQQDDEKPLIDFGTEAVHKSLNFVEKFLYPESSSSAEPIESRPMIRRGSSTSVYQPQNPTVFKKPNQPDDQPTSPVAQLTKEQAQQQFDENLSTIVSMFPNIEPGVCFMVLQANEGRLSESIEKYV
jgi:hypothetical protein